VIMCDDWGYKTGTMLRPETLRQWVFPWHRQLVETVHAAGKVAILHACGNIAAVMEDVFALGYDAKHSYEDTILPVEQAYARYSGRIAVLGGMDVDFLARSTPQAIYTRCRDMLEMTGGRRYALGSGNSITPDIPVENRNAMLRAAEG